MITSKTKAWLSSILALIIAVLCFVACSNEADEGVKVPPSNTPQAQIITELQEFNNSLVVMPESRKLKWYQWISVALSDACGAISGANAGKIGMIICAVNASFSKYMEYLEKNDKLEAQTHNKIGLDSYGAAYAMCKDKVVPSDYTLGLSYNLDSCSINIGILHNKIIDCIEDVALKNNLDIWLAKLPPNEKAILEDEKFKVLFNKISLTPPMRLDNTDTTPYAVMQLYLEAVEEQGQNEETFKAINVKYISKIQNSIEISKKEKEIILSGISVMIYSYDYWSERLQ